MKSYWKKYKKIITKGLTALGNLDSFSRQINLKCPKCNARLYELFFAEGGYSQNYVCRKCNYTGSLGLRLTKRTKRKTIMKM